MSIVVSALTALVILIGALVLLAAGAFFGGMEVARRRNAEVERAIETCEAEAREKLFVLLRETRAGVPWRAEVTTEDWGPDAAEMRWRWTVWDADRVLVVTTNPETARIGIEIPFMLGNAPTKHLALREAMTWIAEEAKTTAVIRP